jgi:hypothetical protein
MIAHKILYKTIKRDNYAGLWQHAFYVLFTALYAKSVYTAGNGRYDAGSDPTCASADDAGDDAGYAIDNATGDDAE